MLHAFTGPFCGTLVGQVVMTRDVVRVLVCCLVMLTFIDFRTCGTNLQIWSVIQRWAILSLRFPVFTMLTFSIFITWGAHVRMHCVAQQLAILLL